MTAEPGRRQVLRRAGVLAAAAAVGAGLAEGRELMHDQGRKRALNASVGALPRRGHARAVWSASTTEKLVALTFDDGPTTQLTARVLQVVERAGVTATFFMIGECVDRHPDLARRVHDAGHEIANHGYDHVRAPGTDPDSTAAALHRGAETLERVVGMTPRWYRPPRGELTTNLLHVAGAAGQDAVIWSVERGPSADDDVPGVRDHLIGAIHPGAIVCLHDGIGRSSFDGGVDEDLLTRRETELAALPAVLEAWTAAGYRFVTLSELLKEV